SEKSLDFSDSLQKCRYFPAATRRKSPRSARREPCRARFPGHSIPLEAGCRPLELPRQSSGKFLLTEFFVKRKKTDRTEMRGTVCFLFGSGFVPVLIGVLRP